MYCILIHARIDLVSIYNCFKFCFVFGMLTHIIPGDIVMIEQFLNVGVTAELLTYINGVSDCKFQTRAEQGKYFIYTQSMQDALEKMRNNRTVCLDGAKGCGKSYTLAILFLMFQCEEPCLYLTPKSFKEHSYFSNFLDKHKDLFQSSNLADVFENKAVDIHSDYVTQLITTFLATGSLKVFIDFGKVSAYTEGDDLQKLCKVTSIVNPPPNALKMCIILNVMLGSEKRLFQHVGVQVIIAKII